MSLQLAGFPHLTAVTANVRSNHGFSTKTLGLRRVKKSVDQDDVFAYHLFYAEGNATPGTDITTDEPGFTVDEPLAIFGQRLALPPFL